MFLRQKWWVALATLVLALAPLILGAFALDVPRKAIRHLRKFGRPASRDIVDPNLLTEFSADGTKNQLDSPAPPRAAGDSSWFLASRFQPDSPVKFLLDGPANPVSAWTSPIPGRGHSTPVVVGNRIYLTTALDDSASAHALVLAYDQSTGRELWRTVAHLGSTDSAKSLHPDASPTSSTLATDGSTLFFVAYIDGRIEGKRFDTNGRMIGTTSIGGHTLYQGYSSSPALTGSRFIGVVSI